MTAVLCWMLSILLSAWLFITFLEITKGANTLKKLFVMIVFALSLTVLWILTLRVL